MNRKVKEIMGAVLAVIFVLVPAIAGALMFVKDFIESLPHLLRLYIVIFVFFIAPFFALYFAIDWLLKRSCQKRKAERDRKFEEMLLGLRKFEDGDYDD